VREPDSTAAAPELSAAERKHLSALGYIYFAEEEADDRDGVVRFDPERAAPGYSLYSIRYRCRAELIDLDGTLVNAWERRPCQFWSTAELLPSGDLLVTGQDPVARARRGSAPCTSCGSAGTATRSSRSGFRRITTPSSPPGVGS